MSQDATLAEAGGMVKKPTLWMLLSIPFATTHSPVDFVYEPFPKAAVFISGSRPEFAPAELGPHPINFQLLAEQNDGLYENFTEMPAIIISLPPLRARHSASATDRSRQSEKRGPICTPRKPISPLHLRLSSGWYHFAALPDLNRKAPA
jgi:hypothetical protein